MKPALPPCQKCQFYKVTWNGQEPHACSFFGFQSHLLPVLEVYHSTGFACPQYQVAGNFQTESERQGRKNFDKNFANGKELGDEIANELDNNFFCSFAKDKAPNNLPEDFGKNLGQNLGNILGEKGILS